MAEGTVDRMESQLYCSDVTVTSHSDRANLQVVVATNRTRGERESFMVMS